MLDGGGEEFQKHPTLLRTAGCPLSQVWRVAYSAGLPFV